MDIKVTLKRLPQFVPLTNNAVADGIELDKRSHQMVSLKEMILNQNTTGICETYLMQQSIPEIEDNNSP